MSWDWKEYDRQLEELCAGTPDLTPEAVVLAHSMHDRCYTVAREWRDVFIHDPDWENHRTDTQMLGERIMHSISGLCLGQPYSADAQLARKIRRRCRDIAQIWTTRIRTDPEWVVYRTDPSVLGGNIAQEINGGGLGFEHFLVMEWELPMLPVRPVGVLLSENPSFAVH